MHRELRMLVDAGLTPFQALEVATNVPAMFLEAERDFGSLQVGKRADMVVLDANPPADIRNTTTISRVAVGDRWFDKLALDVMIREAGRRLNP
jgi:imidazolonepropionase-like amidohydrolase